MRHPARPQPSPHPVRWRSTALAVACTLGLRLLGATAEAETSVVVLTADGHPLPAAVVAVYGGGAARPAAPVHAIMDQVNRTFQPDVLVVPVGSTVEFPNSDSVSHQIYSFSPARRFQLPLYRGKPYPPVHFDQAGLVVLGCNIHDSMLGYVLVTDAPWYGRTDTSGTWSADLPAGSYRVRIWHARMRDRPAIERELTVTPQGAHLQVSLLAALRPEHLDESRVKDAY